MNKKGFTLMELLAVIAILAILIIVLLPNIIKLMNDTKKENFSNEIKAIVLLWIIVFKRRGYLWQSMLWLLMQGQQVTDVSCLPRRARCA
jgi:prepilin-type N-terminal cleavage/methylation domain-containing protein